MNNSKNIIFIVGSKPDAIFPNVQPNLIVAANGALARVQHYHDNCKIIGVFSKYVFFDSNTLSLEKNCKVDKLIIFGSIKKKDYKSNSFVHPERAGIKYNEIKYVSTTRIERIKLTYYNKLFLIKHLLRNYSLSKKLSLCITFLKKRVIKPLKISTGMISLIFAIREIRTYSTIYIIGYGLNSKNNEAHFYDQKKLYNAKKHSYPDLLFIYNLKKKYPYYELMFTDPLTYKKMNEINSSHPNILKL